MPMIDVYAAEGAFADRHTLARDLAAAVMGWSGVPDLSLFRSNTAAFVHHMPAETISNVNGGQQLRPRAGPDAVGVLDREKQLGVVRELTDIVAAAAGDATLVDRTWVLIYESPEGGWGINGHSNTGGDMAAAAHAELTAAAADGSAKE